MTEPMFATWRLHTKVSLCWEESRYLCSNAGTLGPWVSAFSWSSPLLRVSSEGWLSGFCHFTPGGESTALWLQRSCSKRWGNYIAREVFLPVRFRVGQRDVSSGHVLPSAQRIWSVFFQRRDTSNHGSFRQINTWGFFFNRCRFLEKAHPAASGNWFVAFGWSCRVTASLWGGGESHAETPQTLLCEGASPISLRPG